MDSLEGMDGCERDYVKPKGVLPVPLASSSTGGDDSALVAVAAVVVVKSAASDVKASIISGGAWILTKPLPASASLLIPPTPSVQLIVLDIDPAAGIVCPTHGPRWALARTCTIIACQVDNKEGPAGKGEIWEEVEGPGGGITGEDEEGYVYSCSRPLHYTAQMSEAVPMPRTPTREVKTKCSKNWYYAEDDVYDKGNSYLANKQPGTSSLKTQS
ncbi:hypothetical protein FPV67DRAFT_1459756 [Lyophyllum atratum]|nr:hypothetical protein FPV67DRAFT_1459756 [Lyophyllum atratum]